MGLLLYVKFCGKKKSGVSQVTGSYLHQLHVLVDGLLLSGEALLQLVGEAGPAAVDGVDAAVFGRSQHHLVVGILQRLPLKLPVGHLVQHAAEGLVFQQVTNVVDSCGRRPDGIRTQQEFMLAKTYLLAFSLELL